MEKSQGMPKECVANEANKSCYGKFIMEYSVLAMDKDGKASQCNC
jgi:hypothetical protein